jgi:hypothetical protein
MRVLRRLSDAHAGGRSQELGRAKDAVGLYSGWRVLILRYHVSVALTQAEFEALVADRSKRIDGDISWSEDEDHSPAVEFRVEIASDPGYPLFVRGSYNAVAKALTFALIHRSTGRIYALDLGKDHHNPACTYTGDKHKHSWTETTRDREAYVPSDITASVGDPVAVWSQFCAEAAITHNGVLHTPPPAQLEL